MDDIPEVLMVGNGGDLGLEGGEIDRIENHRYLASIGGVREEASLFAREEEELEKRVCKSRDLGCGKVDEMHITRKFLQNVSIGRVVLKGFNVVLRSKFGDGFRSKLLGTGRGGARVPNGDLLKRSDGAFNVALLDQDQIGVVGRYVDQIQVLSCERFREAGDQTSFIEGLGTFKDFDGSPMLSREL